LEREQLALDLWRPQYNVLTVAGALIGFLQTPEEFQILMSELRKGEKNPFFGKTHTEEVRK
jgi:hypothetical protein